MYTTHMLLIASAALVLLSAPSPTTVPLKNGLVISKSCVVTAKEYLLPTKQGVKKAGDEQIPALTPAIVIRGNNLTVDFHDAVLRGTPATTEPDERKGLGIQVIGNNITIKNLHVHGYMVGLLASHCNGLRILNSDFSYNWKQRLMSTPDKEDESDWQSYHHNENGEWFRYGAAMYLDGCNKFEVKGTRAVGGQCGLMLNRSNGGKVSNNNFSFLSGIGLGMYRSSNNRIEFNKMDWCVRGFSYGVYNRGQDSAGILIFELCNNNLFAFNSVTHGGDGFFLWAGQTMMDSGKGGCNGNVLYGNDFSHSPCNAIEATFSSNAFIRNKLVECWHGVWGGYSFDTQIKDNTFGFNGESIAIEHGQDISITGNQFIRENTAINLWQDPITDKNWGYGKYHDTDSRDYQIVSNVFDRSAGPAISIRNTHRAHVAENQFLQCVSALKEAGVNTGSTFDLGSVTPGKAAPRTITPGGQPLPGTSNNVSEYLHRLDLPWTPTAGLQDLNRLIAEKKLGAPVSLKQVASTPSAFLKKGGLKGQRYILVDKWGPYDFRSPKLWAREKLSNAPAGVARRRFEILGPVGHWRLLAKSGVLALSKTSGEVPGFVDIDLPASQATKTEIQLEYKGAATVDHRGIATPAGKPVKFGFSEFFAPIDWNVKFFKWDAINDPRTKADDFKSLISGTPIKNLHLSKLDFAGASFDPATGNDHFATMCDGSFTVPAGNYTLEVTTDDGARVWVDGKPVITNAWKYQGPTLYTAPLRLDATKHKIRVEHFQIDGYAMLKVSLKPSAKR